MFVELLDKLRCPHDHEDNPLVVTTSVTHERYIVEGTLGCSVCLAEYRVHKGVMDMEGDFPVFSLTQDAFSEEKTMRAAALLGLDERGGLYLVDLMGQFSVSSYLDMSPDSQFVAMSVMSRNQHAMMSICGRPNVLPFATGCMRGIAFDWDVSDSLLQSAVKTLAPGGRLGRAGAHPVPKGVDVDRARREQLGRRAACDAGAQCAAPREDRERLGAGQPELVDIDGRRLRHRVEHGTRDVVGIQHVGRFWKIRAFLRRQPVPNRSVGGGGRNETGAHSRAARLGAEHLVHRAHAELRRRIAAVTGIRRAIRDGADGDDVSAFRGQHRREECANESLWREKIHVDHRVEIIFSQLVHGADAKQSGVVDENVRRRSKRRHDRRCRRAAGLGVHEIARDGNAPAPSSIREFRQRILAARHECDTRTRTGEHARDRLADPARCAGDDGIRSASGPGIDFAQRSGVDGV